MHMSTDKWPLSLRKTKVAFGCEEGESGIHAGYRSRGKIQSMTIDLSHYSFLGAYEGKLLVEKVSNG